MKKTGMIIASIIAIFLIVAIIIFSFNYYPGSALESALTLRDGISWYNFFGILILAGVISAALALLIFWMFSLRGYNENFNNESFKFISKFALTVMLVVALLLFFDTVQFGVIASGLSIWALLSTMTKGEN